MLNQNLQQGYQHPLSNQFTTLLSNLSVSLQTTAQLPHLTSPLTEQERHWLRSHTLADLVTYTMPANNEPLFLRFAKDVAISVMTNVATEAIIIQYNRSLDTSTEKPTEVHQPDVSDEEASRQQEQIISEVVREEMQSQAEQIDRQADNLADELVDDILKKVEDKNPGTKGTKDYDGIKKEIKSQLKEGIKDTLNRDIEQSMKSDLKEKTKVAQKQVKKDAKSIGRPSKKELRQIAKDAKVKHHNKVNAKIKAGKGLAGAAIDFSSNLSDNPGDVGQAIQETSKGLAQDKATEVFVEKLGSSLQKISPKASSVVLRYGFKFFGVMSMLLDSDTIGPEPSYQPPYEPSTISAPNP